MGILILFGILLLVLFFIFLRPRVHYRLPPGPPGWPVIGNLHHLGKLPHQKFAQLAQLYGPIFYIQLGSMPTVVISSPALAKEVLQAKDLVFADRPHIEGGNRVFYPDSIFLMHYGPRWRFLRKFCMLELFTTKRLRVTTQIRLEETLLMLQDVQNQSNNGKLAINLTRLISDVMADIMCRLLISRKVSERDTEGKAFTEVIHQMGTSLGAPVVGDFIPYLGWLDAQKKRKMDRLHEIIDNLLENVLAEHRQVGPAASRDLVDMLLLASQNNDGAEKITDETIKATLMNLLAAGIDTTAHTVEWAMAELLRNPAVFRKLQNELDFTNKDEDRLVNESDLPNLCYLQAVVKETFRLHPDVPLLLPHLSNKSCEVAGYFIPKKTRLLVNVWAIGRSPSVWESAQEFRPDRFYKKSIDVRGQSFELIPFGAGRRICLGLPLAMNLVELVLANLVRCFDWILPDRQNPMELDMSECEEFGVAIRMSKPLILIPKLRFPAIPKP